MILPTKVCTKCRVELPASFENFYRHPTGRHGFTPRCKPCVNEDNATNEARRRDRDPEAEKAKNRVKASRHYHKDIEASRAMQREAAARARRDPERRAVIDMRKRGGGAKLSPADFNQLLASQNGRCAICLTTEPAGKTGTAGWNLDHCHKTNKVRFILCGPCNRGLAAFRDNPARLRRAADMLETINIVCIEVAA